MDAVRGGGVAEERDETAVAQLHDGWLRDADAGHGPRERPGLPAVARDRHRGEVEVLVGERHQERAVLQRDRMHTRHPSQTPRERIVEPIEQAARPLHALRALPARAPPGVVGLARDRFVQPVRFRDQEARALPAGRAGALVVASRPCTEGSRCPTCARGRRAASRARATAASRASMPSAGLLSDTPKVSEITNGASHAAPPRGNRAPAIRTSSDLSSSPPLK